jgi:iron-sulfur cluster assembly 2
MSRPSSAAALVMLRGMARRHGDLSPRSTTLLLFLRQQQRQRPWPSSSCHRSMVTITRTQAAEEESPIAVTELSRPTYSSTHHKQQSLSSSSPSVTVTEACWNRIRELNATAALSSSSSNAKTNKFLRVVVDAGGCSGFSYQFQLDDQLEPDDHVVMKEHNDGTTSQVVVDPDSLQLIQGSVIDYETSMMKSAFRVQSNPQSESACGCGSSFAIKKFAANPAHD